ncbi:hypothetical protein LCGC14_2186310 [marine sediment metagenome]|uniref:Uncharacterized protein n=1 Tax=marine sediment metagenome TaxID=412755 RepID=A0A0F9GGP2_9ZZZZ
MTWIQKLMHKFLCRSKGHSQVRDWTPPTFPTLSPCDRCGLVIYQQWTPPSLLNILFSGK